MSNIKLIFRVILICILLTNICLSNDNKTEFAFSMPVNQEQIKISTDEIEISSLWTAPELVEKNNRNWQFVNRNESENSLAGAKGILISDIFTNDDLRLTREFWYSLDKTEIAIRQVVTNLKNDAINLKSLIPLKIDGTRGSFFKNQPSAENWNVLIQKRLKNGRPASIKPSDEETIEIDQFAVFHANNGQTPDLLIGFLSQTGHLARFDLQFTKIDDEISFNSLTAECEFDGVLIPAGGERISQWVYIKSGYDPNELVTDFADKVGIYHGVNKPVDPAPSVFCTWYFHGRNYNEQYFMEDIKSLNDNYIPFDVFLIDDCWANGNWGYWTTGDAFPSGMKNITETMRKSGYKPGIWTAPYSVNMNSDLAKDHPEWLLRTDQDSLVVFGYSVKAWILDPTYPGVIEHLENVYRRLAHDYGFSYFKFDFMRSVFIYDNVKFYDPHKTRLEAYRMGLEAIRRGTGPDAYISVCGGHFGGSLGIANSQRSGSDVVSMWVPKQTASFRQNILRTWMSRLWHVDPDALMIRKRDKPYHDPNNKQSKLALGKLNDEEALTFTLNQYVGGGMVCFSEYLKELQPERRKLYRHVIPSIDAPSRPLDIYNTFCPTKMLTEVKPLCENLVPWNTVAISNWTEDDDDVQIKLDDRVVGSLKSEKFIVSEFFSQKVLGIFSKNETTNLGIVPAHQSRLLRIAPWNGSSPVLTGTDLHFSGGGVEIEKWSHSNNTVEGILKTEWNYPVNISIAFPSDSEAGYTLKTTSIAAGQKLFYVAK